jgi:hypothetical protein
MSSTSEKASSSQTDREEHVTASRCQEMTGIERLPELDNYYDADEYAIV